MLMWTARVVCTQSMETWDIWYIDEGFLVLIIPSRHQSYEPIYWAHTTGFVASYIFSVDASFMFGCTCPRHDFQCMLLIRIYWYMCACPCMPLGFITPLIREFLTPLDLHVHILEVGACGFSWLLIKDAQRKCGLLTDRPESFPSRPL